MRKAESWGWGAPWDLPGAVGGVLSELPPDQKLPASGFWQDTLWTLRYTISFPAEQQARSALTQKLAGMEAPPRPLVPMCVSGSLPGQGRAHRGIKERRAE